MDGIDVFVKNEKFAGNLAKKNGWETYRRDDLDAWYLGPLNAR